MVGMMQRKGWSEEAGSMRQVWPAACSVRDRLAAPYPARPGRAMPDQAATAWTRQNRPSPTLPRLATTAIP